MKNYLNMEKKTKKFLGWASLIGGALACMSIFFNVGAWFKVFFLAMIGVCIVLECGFLNLNQFKGRMNTRKAFNLTSGLFGLYMLFLAVFNIPNLGIFTGKVGIDLLNFMTRFGGILSAIAVVIFAIHLFTDAYKGR